MVWNIGTPFLKKYLITFNRNDKLLYFYKKTNNEDGGNESTNQSLHIKYIIIISVLSVVFLASIGTLIFYIIKIKPRKRIDNIVNKAFLEEEKEYYYNLDNDNERIDYFYYIWTQKESYVKFLGVGIRGYFNNVKIGYNKNINTKKINIDNINYYLSICSNNIERKNIDIIYE